MKIVQRSNQNAYQVNMTKKLPKLTYYNQANPGLSLKYWGITRIFKKIFISLSWSYFFQN